MKTQGNEITRYMDDHNWKHTEENSRIYTNGRLYVFCSGDEWIISKTPDQSERYSKSYKNMLSAFKFADSKIK